ncbi:uncharacterized protein [Henckelia pumila]|uniref:uncharacterized protein n=1 Tax=Henckelia pumila TaxID=405737 RepID=UPI003C6E96B3
MDENTRAYLTYLLNSTQNSQENASSQNPQIPPTHQYPHPFPNMQFPPQNVQNFPGFGNFMSHPNYTSRGPTQPLPAEYWQNTSHPPFTPPVLQGFGTPYTTGTHFSSSMPTEPASPTFVPETQLSDRESPIEVVNLEKTIPNAEGTRKRSTWTKVEDEVLATSFVTISDDPIIGNDQKADAFWRRVASYYNDNRPADRPMFTPQSDDHFVATKKTRTSESGASNTSSNQNVSVDIDDEDNRPMGRKAAKRKGKDKVKSTMEDLTVNYNSIFSKFNEYTNVKKSEVDLKQKQLEVEEIKAKYSLSNAEAKNRRLRLKEYEILNKDTSEMTTEKLIIHECLCKDIRSSWNI